MPVQRVWSVEVSVALDRPPRADKTRFYRVAAAGRTEAELIACQMAAAHSDVTMPVASRLLEA